MAVLALVQVEIVREVMDTCSVERDAIPSSILLRPNALWALVANKVLKYGKSAQKYTLVSCSFLPPQPKTSQKFQDCEIGLKL